MYLTVASLCALVCLTSADTARAWGCKGHQTVALIAEKHLTPDAKQMVQLLLSSNPIDLHLKRYCGNVTNDLMVDASTWPDDVRGDRKNGPWHYIDIPRGTHGGTLKGYCGPGSCITQVIEEQRKFLRDRTADAGQRAEALRYLIHFVADLHQPLHAINNGDNGGNCVPVKYFRHEPLPNPFRPEHEDYSPNLHQVWDTEIVERDMEISSPQRYADELDERFRSESAKWEAAGIQVETWAWETHERAEKEVYAALPQKIGVEPDVKPANCADNNHIAKRMLEKHEVIGDAYQAKASQTVEMSIAEAGVRLAMILNEAAKAAP